MSDTSPVDLPFSIVAYDGGQQEDCNDECDDNLTIDNVLNNDRGLYHCSNRGGNFNLVLRYKPDDEDESEQQTASTATLTHVVILFLLFAVTLTTETDSNRNITNDSATDTSLAPHLGLHRLLLPASASFHVPQHVVHRQTRVPVLQLMTPNPLACRCHIGDWCAFNHFALLISVVAPVDGVNGLLH